MVKLYDENDCGYIEVDEFYCNDFPRGMTEAQMRNAFLKMYERLRNFYVLYNSTGT